MTADSISKICRDIQKGIHHHLIVTMTIKRATFIALCGNVAAILIRQIAVWTDFRLYRIVGRFEWVIMDLLSFGTIVFFLFTLYRKQN